MKEQGNRITKQLLCFIISFMVVINFIPLSFAENTGVDNEENNAQPPAENPQESEEKVASDMPLGNDWTLGDFIYNKNKVTGFSSSGLEKVKTQKNLILPHINPEDGLEVDTVGINEDDNTSFRNRGLTSISDFNGNITRIEGEGSNWTEDTRTKGVFAKNDISSIKLDNVTHIGSYAFMDNKISKLHLPNVVTLGSHTFQDNLLGQILEEDLPKVKSMDDLTFSGNKLTKVVIPSLSSVRTATFFGNEISEVKFDSLETVGVTAFRANKLREVTPTNFPVLKYLEDLSFADNDIIDVDLPEAIVLNDAFSGNVGSNANIKVKDNFRKLEILGESALYNKGITELTIPNLKEIGYGALAGNPGVSEDKYGGLYKGKVVIWTTNNNVPTKENYLVNPDRNEAGEGEYEDSDFTWDKEDPKRLTGFSATGISKFNKKLKAGDGTIVLPDRATSVGKSAFNGIGITAVSGKNVEIVEGRAFLGNKLTDINSSFPKLKEIKGKYAFGANMLTSINLPNLEKVSDGTFIANKITEVTLDNVKNIGDSAFARNKINSVVIPVCETVGDLSFGGDPDYGQEGSPVSSITAPMLKKIGKGAFMDHKLKELDLPNVEEIGLAAFSYPNKNSAFAGIGRGYPDKNLTGFRKRTLENVNLPKVKVIYDLAFAGNAIKEANIDSVETIERRAFEGNKLSNINLPNIKKIGTKAFRYNRINEAKANKNCEDIANDSFFGNRNNNETNTETKILLEGYENPHNLKDGIVNGTRQHVINPTKVTVKYEDVDGNELQKSFTEYILSEKTYDAISMFGYLVDKQTKTAKDNRKENTVTFVYKKRPDIKNTKGIEIYQDNEKDNNSGTSKVRYHIGEKMYTHAYFDLTGIDTSYSEGVIKIYYDNRYIEDESVKITEQGATKIKKWKAHNGVIDVELGNISGGYQLDFPIEWKFKKYVTPNETNMEVNVQFENDGKVLSTAKPIYLQGYYNKPGFIKASPLNLPGYDYKRMSSASNGVRYMGKLDKYVTPENTYEYKITNASPVAYYFYPTELERNITKVVIRDTLPTYTAVRDDGTTETRTAVFDEKLNPSWTLSDDGKTIIQSKSFEGTTSMYGKIDTLYLSFPDMKAGTNVINNASITMTPDNMGNKETEMTGEDDLSIYTSKYQNVVYEGDPRFSKEVSGLRYSQGSSLAFFYDTKDDKNKTLSYTLRASSMAQKSDLVDLTLTDYKLDKRLYYYGISFPYESHTAGNVNLQVTAYKLSGKKMNPGKDKKLFDENIKAAKDNKIVFPTDIAKEIDYVHIVFPDNHKLYSAVEIRIDTKLRNPEKEAYSKDGNNLFKNYAVMAGNLYEKDTKNPGSKRTDPILNEKGVAISNYSDEWDNISGNYLWGEKAEIQVRDYNEEIGFKKTQSYATNRSVVPGETGSYALALVPRIYSNNGEPDYDVVLKSELKNFELVDIMPRGVEPTQIALNPKFEQSGGSYKLVENYNNTGRLGIVFKTDLLKAGVTDIARIDSRISIGAPEGFIENEAYVTFEKPDDKVNLFGAKGAPPNDKSGRIWLQDKRDIRIIKAREMAARQYIREAGELNWLDTGILTKSEEPFEYKLALYNNLSEKRTNTSLVTFFPYVGDISIQEENIGNNVRPERNSQFENTFNTDKRVKLLDENGKDVTDNYDISYWNSKQTIDYQGKSADEVIKNLKWSNHPDKNTRGLKITAKEGVEISANGALEAIVPMRAPKNDITNDFKFSGKKAWNSYVRRDDQTIRFVEPNKVYNEMVEPLGSIEFTKFAKIGINSNEIKPLAGAEFELVKVSKNDEGENVETQVAKAVSNKEGKVKFDKIGMLYDYEIRELESENVTADKTPGKYEKSAKIYKLSYKDFKKWYQSKDKGNYDIKISDEEARETFLNVQPIYGDFKMEKVDSKGQKMSKMHFIIEGISESNKDVKIDKYTDENGLIEIRNLIEGKYKLTELPINAGTKVDSGTSYVPIKPIEFVIDKDHRNIDYSGAKRIVNKDIQLLVNKVGVKSVSDIPSNDQLKDFTDVGKDKLQGFKFKITEVNNPEKYVETNATGEKGYVLVKGLKTDTLYEISEVTQNDPNYKHNPTKYRFKITDDTKVINEKGEVFTQSAINFANAPRDNVGKIVIKKVNDSDKLLEGAEFTLYKEGSDKKIAVKTTGKDGVVEFDNLALGKYVVKETKSPVNHKLIEKPMEVTIDKPEQVVEKTFSNQELISVNGIKKWVDDGNKKEKRPESIVIKLMNGKNEVARKTVSEEDGWKWSFKDLPKKENGREIVYTIIEEKVKGYTSKVEGDTDKGFEVINTIIPPEIPPRDNVGKIVIKKVNDSDKLLEGAEFTLYKEGSDKKIAVKTTGKDGVVEFDNLALGKYVVKETKSPVNHKLIEKPMEVTIDKPEQVVEKTFSNQELISVNGIKKWVDDGNKKEKRPESIVIKLMNGKNEVARKTVSEEDGWKWSFKDLPKKENGREIVYTIIEEKVKGYTSKVEGDTDKGFEVINTIIPPETPPVAPPEKPPVTPPEKPSPKLKQPDTGDGKILGMCAGTIIISALGIGLAVARKRKNK